MTNFKHKKNAEDDQETELASVHPAKGLQRPLKKKTPQDKTPQERSLLTNGPPPGTTLCILKGRPSLLKLKIRR